MVDDEYLNGYARLCGINATGVYSSLCRHANKNHTCFPSKKLISEELGIGERTVYNAIKKLEEWNIIKIEEKSRKKDGTFASLTYVLLDKKYWKNKPTAQSADGIEEHHPTADNDIIQRHHMPSKETHIEGNTDKETHIAKQVSQKIPIFIKEFEKVNKACKDFYQNTTQRKAVEKLIDSYGEEKVFAVISVLPRLNRVLYNKATTPVELWNKWSKIEAEASQLKNKSSKYAITKTY